MEVRRNTPVLLVWGRWSTCCSWTLLLPRVPGHCCFVPFVQRMPEGRPWSCFILSMAGSWSYMKGTAAGVLLLRITGYASKCPARGKDCVQLCACPSAPAPLWVAVLGSLTLNRVPVSLPVRLRSELLPMFAFKDAPPIVLLFCDVRISCCSWRVMLWKLTGHLMAWVSLAFLDVYSWALKLSLKSLQVSSLSYPHLFTTPGHFSGISESVPFFVKGPQTQCALPGAGQGQETSPAAPAIHPACHSPQECEWDRGRGWRLKSQWPGWPGMEGTCILSILWHGACDWNASWTEVFSPTPQITPMYLL